MVESSVLITNIDIREPINVFFVKKFEYPDMVGNLKKVSPWGATDQTVLRIGEKLILYM